MGKLLKKLTLLSLPVLCAVAIAACSAPTGPQNYNVAGVRKDIPTITSIVGDRNLVGSAVSRYANPEDGNVSVECLYSGAGDVDDDIARYCTELTQNNVFLLQKAYDGESAVLVATSTIEGQSICMTITSTDGSGYKIETTIVENSAAPSVLAVVSEADSESSAVQEHHDETYSRDGEQSHHDDESH